MLSKESATNYRPLENFHIVLWLVKDLCWCTLSKTLGVVMIVPTIAMAIYITYLNRKEKAELFHNLAIVFWICANSVWMIGELFYQVGLRQYALVFFIAGIITISYYYFSLFFSKTK